MRDIKFGYTTGHASIEETIRRGLLAEKCGFKSIWVPDHFVPIDSVTVCPETWTLITALGMKTREAMLSSSVTDSLRRHPATIAQIIATLDNLLNGRIALGIGAGEAMNTTPYGIKYPVGSKAIKRLKESIECIKLLWTATRERAANYNGEFFQLKNAYLTMKPLQVPHPPVYVGALGTRTRELVGEVADGWYPWITSPEVYTERLKDIERGAKRVGRTLDEIDAIARIYTAVSDDYIKSKSVIESKIKRALVLERRTLKQLGYEIKLPEKLTVQQIVSPKEGTKNIAESANSVPTEAVEAVGVFGTIDECIDKIERYVKAGARHVVTFNMGSDETIKQYNKIISYFAENY